MPTLYYRKGTTNYGIRLYSEAATDWRNSNPKLHVKFGGVTYYAALSSSTSDLYRSDLTVRSGGTTYRVLSVSKCKVKTITDLSEHSTPSTTVRTEIHATCRGGQSSAGGGAGGGGGASTYKSYLFDYQTTCQSGAGGSCGIATRYNATSVSETKVIGSGVTKIKRMLGHYGAAKAGGAGGSGQRKLNTFPAVGGAGGSYTVGNAGGTSFVWAYNGSTTFNVALSSGAGAGSISSSNDGYTSNYSYNHPRNTSNYSLGGRGGNGWAPGGSRGSGTDAYNTTKAGGAGATTYSLSGSVNGTGTPGGKGGSARTCSGHNKNDPIANSGLSGSSGSAGSAGTVSCTYYAYY